MSFLTGLGQTVLLLLLTARFALAHEFWLEPLEYHVDPGDTLEVHIKVGQYFKGNTYSYFPQRFESFQIHRNGQQQPIDGRLGQLPAVAEPMNRPGLVRLSYHSTDRFLTYDKAETFETFVKDEGLTGILERHRERGLPGVGFTEAYRRYAKTYVSVGSGQGRDTALGLPLEWVLQDNPYRLEPDQTLHARLLYRGEPFPDRLVRVFIRHDGQVKEHRLRTNREGEVALPTVTDAEYLINSVHMIEAPESTASTKDAVWLSLWASATFQR